MTHLTTFPEVAMTVTFYSDQKHFAFAARNDTGASCYISPMLAEQAGLERSSAGRVLTGRLAPNTDDHGGQATASTPWRVMAWTSPLASMTSPPSAARRDLEIMLRDIDQLRDRLAATIAHLT